MQRSGEKNILGRGNCRSKNKNIAYSRSRKKARVSGAWQAKWREGDHEVKGRKGQMMGYLLDHGKGFSFISGVQCKDIALSFLGELT